MGGIGRIADAGVCRQYAFGHVSDRHPMADKTATQTLTRSEVGTRLRDFGDDVKLEGAARLEVGDDVVSLNPPTDVEYAVTIDDESADGTGETRELTIELTWEKTDYDEEVSGTEGAGTDSRS